jgi:hypothetical protein
VAFIGCATEGNRWFLYRVAKNNPNTPQREEMNFPCDVTTTITDRKPAGTGVRWVWTPGKGLLALDKDFKVIYTTNGTVSVSNLAVAPDGNAFIYNATSVHLVTPQGIEKWGLELADGEIPGRPIGDPLVIPAGKLVMPFLVNHTDTTDILVLRVDYANPKGKPSETFEIDELDPMQTPWVAFNATGSVLYLGTQQQNSVTVRGCAIGQTKPCQAGFSQSRLWISDAIPGSLAALIPYSNNNRLAVITSNRFWFLDVTRGSISEGRIVNKDQQPLTPSGALVGRFAQPGKGEAFYMFNSAPGTSEIPNPHAVELLATDAAERGLVYRYQLPGGQNLYGALDDAGTLWLRLGRKLVKPFSLDEYRQMP